MAGYPNQMPNGITRNIATTIHQPLKWLATPIKRLRRIVPSMNLCAAKPRRGVIMVASRFNGWEAITFRRDIRKEFRRIFCAVPGGHISKKREDKSLIRQDKFTILTGQIYN